MKQFDSLFSSSEQLRCVKLELEGSHKLTPTIELKSLLSKMDLTLPSTSMEVDCLLKVYISGQGESISPESSPEFSFLVRVNISNRKSYYSANKR